MEAMTDELVKRLRSMHWCVTTETNGVGVSDRKVALEAADRIEQLVATNEQLTAERDEAWAYMSALQGDLYDAIMIKAERDRLRKELEKIVDDCEAEYPPSHGAIKYAARMALKGE